MVSFLRQHALTFFGLALAANLGLLTYLVAGDVKVWAEIHWLDVLGEGGSMLIWVLWLVMLLRGRPAGRVTRLLALGLCCVCLSWWMDVLDEFIRLPADSPLGNWLENAPMPVGLILLTVGLYHLHQEQQAISAQMRKRERHVREHRLFDRLTPLATAPYLRQQIAQALAESRRDRQPLSLVAVDLDDFSRINQEYGEAEGDQVLVAVSQILLLNLRSQDLLCRLAGDRFVALLPNTGLQQAEQMAAELQQAVASLAHRSQQHGERLPLRASVASVMALDDEPDALLQRLNRGMARAKQQLARCA